MIAMPAFASAPGGQPQSVRAGEWACHRGLCPVRTVRLRLAAVPPLRLPRLRCPVCLRALEFVCELDVSED
jgi:hypothetical protein